MSEMCFQKFQEFASRYRAKAIHATGWEVDISNDGQSWGIFRAGWEAYEASLSGKIAETFDAWLTRTNRQWGTDAREVGAEVWDAVTSECVQASRNVSTEILNVIQDFMSGKMEREEAEVKVNAITLAAFKGMR